MATVFRFVQLKAQQWADMITEFYEESDIKISVLAPHHGSETIKYQRRNYVTVTLCIIWYKHNE